MTLVTNDIPIKVRNVQRDDQGRFLILDCVVDDSEFILVNLYAPTSDKRLDQRSFGDYVCTQLEPYIGKSIVLGGDLNICLDEISKPASSHNKLYFDSMHKLMNNFDLVDIWRLKHPNTNRSTRREKTRYGFIQSRIDFLLISCHLEFFVKSVDIVPSIKSDHSLLTLSLVLQKDHARGKGLWKFNSSLLQDNDYQELVRDTIKEGLEDSKNLESKELTWDYLKCRIRTMTISFSMKKKKANTKHLAALEKKLSILEALLNTTPSIDNQNEYLEAKKEVESIHDDIARGHMIRSRCKFIEEYERPTKYFLNLEKASQNIRHIRSLKIGNGVSFDPNRILNHQRSYYSNLYKENNELLNFDDKYCRTIEKTLPKISTESKELCDQKQSLMK